jgi:hypothetical protein
MGGAPKGYDVAAYARDVSVFAPYLKKATLRTIFLGPGGVGEGRALPLPTQGQLSTKDILAATGPVFEALNGRVLDLQADDALPPMNGIKTLAGNMALAPQSITFIGIPHAGNEACNR